MMNEQNKFNIEKYVNALNDLLGVDHGYFLGDEKVDTLVELIVMAKELSEENAVLKAQLEPFKVKKCFTCVHRNVGDDHMPCYACDKYDLYEWLGDKR
jgi:hypothetical protein